MNGNQAASREQPERTLAELIAVTAQNAHAMAMRTIVVMKGDESEQVQYVAGRLCNEGETGAILGYLPVVVTARQQSDAEDALTAMSWPRTEVGEVVLVYSGCPVRSRACGTSARCWKPHSES